MQRGLPDEIPSGSVAIRRAIECCGIACYAGGHHLHVPDASGSPSGPSGAVPEVRHDARANPAESGRR
ncbi:hypothetical protein BVI434_310043 [Burkholderia vietnamiensis]|nr:hypothetical protein BVI434_310043 [Burkholderia vietnamiensis]CAG9222513.1 hypothetical protein BVI1335_400095 [Burkholderia vietnamiensis]